MPVPPAPHEFPNPLWVGRGKILKQSPGCALPNSSFPDFTAARNTLAIFEANGEPISFK